MDRELGFRSFPTAGLLLAYNSEFIYDIAGKLWLDKKLATFLELNLSLAVRARFWLEKPLLNAIFAKSMHTAQ